MEMGMGLLYTARLKKTSLIKRHWGLKEGREPVTWTCSGRELQGEGTEDADLLVGVCDLLKK